MLKKSTWVVVAIAATLLASGCATKKYVSKEVGAVNQKVETLSESVERNQERIGRNESLIAQPEARSVIEFLLQQGLGEATDVLLIDESICVRCDNCETACAQTHHGSR